MDNSEIIITGDTCGRDLVVPVIHFNGRDATAPKVYMQAALHADELPGTATLHFLCQKLRQAEAENRIAGDITLVPHANPVGAGQILYKQLQGRFDISSGINFNRDFPLIALSERQTLLNPTTPQTAISALKNNLLFMALGADIVIDLHCDFESLLYTYMCGVFWPDATDFAAAMGLHSVLFSDGQSTAFEEAVGFAFQHDDNVNSPRRFVTTLELRGQSDVDERLAKADADGLFNFLTGRGVITSGQSDQSDKTQPSWNGHVAPLDNIEVVCTPKSGTILFNRSLGEEVKTGDLLATIITSPGHDNGTYEITAPQDGVIITRTFNRLAAQSDPLYKILCQAPSTTARPPGALES